MCFLSKRFWHLKAFTAIYRIAENIGGRKLWRIQLFRLFGGENFGEWPLPCAADLNGRYMLSAVIQRRWRKAQTRVS